VEPEPKGKPSLRRTEFVTNCDHTVTSCSLLLALQFCHRAFVLGRAEEANIRKLSYADLDLLDTLVAVVLDVNIHVDFLAVVVQLNVNDWHLFLYFVAYFFVQRALQVEFAWRHHELLADFDAGLLSRFARSVHHLADGQANGVPNKKCKQIHYPPIRLPFMRPILRRVSHKGLEFVVDSTRLARVARSGLINRREIKRLFISSIPVG